jgi:cell division protein FtsI/penicillin-binding protein 2
MAVGRVSILIIGFFIMAIGLSSRLFTVAIVQHDQSVIQAKEQQNVQREVLARRGEIFAQDASAGKPTVIAKSMDSYALSATPRNVVNKGGYSRLLAKVSGLDEATILATLQQGGWYMNPLKHGMSQAEVEALAKQANDLERVSDPRHADVKINFDSAQGDIIYFIGGIFFQREYQRVYPEGPLLGQVLGFVNDHGSGQYGFEEQYNQELKGYAGTVNLEQDSLGTLLQQNNAVQGKDGSSYELSIDRNVQYVVEKELAAQIKDSEAKSGSVIVMDPKTGEIMAMASQPNYDPNHFRDVPADQISVFDNPTISNVQEPGSVMKPLVMAAAMDLGLVTADTTSNFPESVTVDGHVIETALRKAYGVENMSQVLANSDNIAMVWVANKLGNANLSAYLHKFGFGSTTGVDLRNEVAGNVLPVEQWRDINRATMSFGQGVGVTSLQMAAAYCAIAEDGKLVQPRVVHAIINADGSRQPVPVTYGAQVVKPETAQALRTMMVQTVLTAHNRAGVPGYKIGGKTGTAQVPDPVNGGYLSDTYNHSFISIGPSDSPRFVMMVNINQPNLKKIGLYAESTAVPLAGRLASFLLDYYQLPPTNR